MTPADAAATGEVLERFLDDLRRFVRRRVPDPDADDVLQEALVRIHRGLPALADDARVAGWVHRVARSAIADHRRRLGRRREAPLGDDPPPDVEPDPDDGVAPVAAEVATWLTDMLEDLPPEQANALRLADQEGLSQTELASRWGLSPSGARTRVQRARAALRKRLDECCRVALDRRGAVLDVTARGGDCC